MKQFNPHEEDNRHIDSLLAEIGALRGFYSITKHGLRGEFYIIVQDRGAITTKNHPLGVLDNDYDVANPALEDRKARSRSNPLAWNGMTSRDFVEAYVGALADSRNPDDITKRRGEGKAALEKLVKNGRVAVPIEVAAYMMTEHGVPKTQKYGRLVGVDTHYRFNEVEDQVIALGVGRGPYRAVEPDERTLGFVAERESHYESLLEALKAHRGEAEPEPAAGAAAPVDRPVPAVVPAARAPAE